MDEPSFHPLDYIAVVSRRKWWLIVPVVICIAAGALLAMFLPKEYLSQATIGVAAPTLSARAPARRQLARPGRAAARDQQQLLSPTVLQRVVREEKIDPDQPVDEIGGLAAASTSPEHLGAAADRQRASDTQKGPDIFILGYTDSDPQRAQRIANRLA